jgi:TetR/AcrR family transcriptional repressor of nem operon
MARSKEYNRDDVLDAATKEFWAKGFKGTSVSDLVSATGLGKRSMYQEFGSKEGLFQECIDNYVVKLNNEVNVILNQQPRGLSNIEGFFRNRIDYATSPECAGCMMVNSAIEKELLEEEAFKQVEKNLARHEEVFYQCLKAAQENGEISKDKDCRTLAGFLFTFATGMMVKSKTHPSRETLEAQVDAALSIVKN